jgi:hypothetical protein
MREIFMSGVTRGRGVRRKPRLSAYSIVSVFFHEKAPPCQGGFTFFLAGARGRVVRDFRSKQRQSERCLAG